MRKQKSVGYVRVSTDAQAEEGYSVDEQSLRLASNFQMRGIKDYEIYVDGGFSGSNLARPKMEQLIQEAFEGLIKEVVVYKLDRLSRSQKDTLYLIEDVFIPNNIAFVSINESLDTSTPYGRAMIGILSAFAQLERENIRMRTRMGMVGRVKEGYWPGGGNVPYGYDYDKNLGILVPNKDADNVKKMYDLYLDGYSPNRIALMFGFPSERLVAQILRRKTNTGVIVYKGEEYQGKHEAIISLEKFNQVQQEIEKRSQLRTVKHRQSYLLTGLVICGKCGAKMRYQKWSPKTSCKLVCNSYDKTKPYLVKDPNCNAEKVWAEPVEDIVIQDLFQLAARIKSEDLKPKEQAPQAYQILEAKAKIVEDKIKKLYNLYAENADDILLDTITENKKELEALKAAIENEKKFASFTTEIEEVKRQIYDIEHNWDDMSFEDRQTIIRSCVDKVVVNGQQVEIYYRMQLGEESSKSKVAKTL